MHPLLISLLVVPVALAGSAPFDPHAYPTSLATCSVTNKTPDKSEPVDITLRYVDINPTASKTILMVHGWPSLWSSWANQIQEFEHDYHLVVPDLRGFGGSGHPPALRGSASMGDFAATSRVSSTTPACAPPSALGEPPWVIATMANRHSHDWGAQVCFEAARMRPDIFSAVIGVTIPYIPTAGPFVPVRDLVPALPALAYQVYLDTKTSDAAAELNKDIRRTLRATLRTAASPPPANFLTSTQSFLDGWKDVDEIPPIPFLSPAEEDYFVDAYTLQGFEPTLVFYMTENRLESWRIAQTQGNASIPQPALSIYPLNVRPIPFLFLSPSLLIHLTPQDPVGDWVRAAKLLKSDDFVPKHTTVTLPGAHWVHMEFPQAVNEAIRGWLAGLDLESAGAGRAEDEL
ncbi:Alpha/Beta hydrolase protein [Infundibulicybe gibba]|nr:Alpha/Beta hydrolase protein [Infundibulicybe gibba]